MPIYNNGSWRWEKKKEKEKEKEKELYTVLIILNYDCSYVTLWLVRLGTSMRKCSRSKAKIVKIFCCGAYSNKPQSRSTQ